MTKEEREEREYKSLYTDERYAKRAFKQLIGAALDGDAVRLPDFEDARGNKSPQSTIYDAAYQNVQTRLKSRGLSRKPSQAEVMIEANVIRAAFDNNVFNTLLDRTAGKVKEELNITAGQYEELSDEELLWLAERREAKALALKNKDGEDNGS